MKNSNFCKHLPNFLTLLNMLFGILVLFINTSPNGENYRFASCVLIMAAVFVDFFDGKAARAFDAVSALGKQLDSFADFVSFGLAPMAIFLTHGNFREIGFRIYLCMALYSIAGAFRLARYNIGDYKDYFFGLPITAAGGFLIIINIILHFSGIAVYRYVPEITMVVILILSVLMVSKIKIYRKY